MVIAHLLQRRTASAATKNSFFGCPQFSVMSEIVYPEAQQLKSLAAARMPYGKYAGRLLVDLPESYVVWIVGQQLPDGLLGRQLLEIYEIKVNGLESLLSPLIPRNHR